MHALKGRENYTPTQVPVAINDHEINVRASYKEVINQLKVSSPMCRVLKMGADQLTGVFNDIFDLSFPWSELPTASKGYSADRCPKAAT